MTNPECDRIIGRPTYETIKHLENQIIGNTMCTTTTLGGGNHRFLGLGKTLDQYALISPVAFTRPNRPGALILAAGLTGPQIAAETRTY